MRGQGRDQRPTVVEMPNASARSPRLRILLDFAEAWQPGRWRTLRPAPP